MDDRVDARAPGRAAPSGARTLVGRMALVQVGVTVAVLGSVLALAFFAITAILTREWDESLVAVTHQVAEEVTGRPPPLTARLVAEELEEHRPTGVRIELQEASGKLVAADGEGPPLTVIRGCADQSLWRVCALEMGPWRVLAGRSRLAGLAARDRFVAATAMAALVISIVVVLFARMITTRALRPLSVMATRIATLQPGAGDRVGPPPRFGELRTLSDSFDDLLARMDEALARERRFSVEASHELKTPLTVLRAEIEALVQADAGGESARRALRSVGDLIALVESLLWFSRAQGLLARDVLQTVNLADLVREQSSVMSGPHPGRLLHVDAPDEVLVAAEERLLGRAVCNVVDNALKYTPADRSIGVRVGVRADQAVVEIQDGGPGIAPELYERVFEPFFRGSRERAGTQGHGLGLPLARAIARAHGGDVRLASSSVTGSHFEILVPLASVDADYRAP